MKKIALFFLSLATLLQAEEQTASGPFVFVDPLLWRGHLGGSSVAVVKNGTSMKAEVSNLHFELDWGLRIGIGYTTPCDGWQPRLIWTYWQNSASKTLSSSETNYPSWGTDPVALDGKGKWGLTYNTLDLENGRPFCISNCFYLRPHAGLRSAWINQRDYNLTYATPTGLLKILQHDRSFGIGIRGGLDLQWQLSSFNIFSNFAGALLYSYHSVKYQENDSTTTNFFHIGNGIFDTQIGLGWTSSFSNCHLNFELGWENLWLPSQNQFMLFVNNSLPGKFIQNQGDLGITGLFFRARFDF